MAAREGGGDIDTNPTLRTDVPEGQGGADDQRHHRPGHQARHRRATRAAPTRRSRTRATRPGGVALLIDVLTDNRNRTGAEVRNVFTKLGGSMAEPGAVGWQFSRQRRRAWSTGAVDEDERDAGRARRRRRRHRRRRRQLAGHVRRRASSTTCRTRSRPPGIDGRVGRHHRWCRDNLVPVDDRRGRAQEVLRIIDALEDNDDVQDVYANFDIADDVMEAVGGRGMSVGVGDQAPDFTLPGTGGATYSLADYAGQPVVLVFYPGDDTPVCTKQLNSLQRRARPVRAARRPGARHLGAGRRQPRAVRRQARLRVPAARRHRQGGRRRLRHARPARLPAAQRVHHRRAAA